MTMTTPRPRPGGRAQPVATLTGTGSGANGKNTINDVARLAGVSKKTVSRVINDSPLVRPDTREALTVIDDPFIRENRPRLEEVLRRASERLGDLELRVQVGEAVDRVDEAVQALARVRVTAHRDDADLVLALGE